MFLSLNWLKDYAEIPGKITPEELGRLLTLHTVEVESITRPADKYKNILVGEILEVKNHPNSGRLHLVKVNVGKDGGELEIVCGADNIAAGQMVPVALIGAVLPNGLQIKEVEIRGIKSRGMLCSEDELGLGLDRTGIMILGKKAKPGKSFAEYLGLDDVIFEVDNKSLTNRPDLWSHLGIAREIAAFLNTGLTAKARKPVAMEKIKPENEIARLKIKIEDYDLCPRYTAVVMDGIKIAPSPAWLRDRLVAAGVRPINNIVDATNYVMLDIGQPLHAFDLVKLRPDLKNEEFDAEIRIRRAGKNAVIKTLDGKERPLKEDMLVIADRENPVAVAGVMGGANSEISDDTASIVIESANFNAISIRKTSRELGLRSDASMRYEKSLDPYLTELGITRSVALIKEVCPGAKVASKVADEKKFKLNTGPLKISFNRLNERIGEKIEWRDAEKILKNLGFGLEKKDDEISLTIPTWRASRDINALEDVVEEVARVYGYNKIASEMPEVTLHLEEKEPALALKRRVQEILAGSGGLYEVYNYSFAGADQLAKLGFGEGELIRLLNPISAPMAILRPSLVPGLADNIKKNQARYAEFGLFEIGHVFLNLPGDLKKNSSGSETLPFEEEWLGVSLAGYGAEEIFLKTKAIIGLLASRLGFTARFSPLESKPGWMDAQAGASIQFIPTGAETQKTGTQNFTAGKIGVIDLRVAKQSGIKKSAAIAEISLKKLVATLPGEKAFNEFEKFPPLVRDLAFVISNKVLYNEFKEEIENFSELIKNAELFDVYEGEKLDPGKKGLAFHIRYLAADRTLTSEEAEDLQAKLVGHLAEKFGAKLRDF